MRLLTVIGLLALAAPAWAQRAPEPARSAAPETLAQVRVSARIVVVDREAMTRAGLEYLVVGNDRVRVGPAGSVGRAGRTGAAGAARDARRSRDARRARGARIAVGTHGVTAFLEAVRESRWVRSESTQQVLTMSGAEARVASTDLTVGRRAARTRGPSLAVIPSVLPDGSVHLRVSTRIEDVVTYPWGHGVDGSPAAVDGELVVADGEEVVLASSSSVRSTREAGLLRWSAGEQGRDVLVLLSARVIRR